MIYYVDKEIKIRSMIKSDTKVISLEETAQGWHPNEEKYIKRYCDQECGKSLSLIAEYQKNVAGYINIYFNSLNGSFGGLGWCEIVDFGVLEKYRNRGIGSKLMGIAEEIASDYADSVYLAVGLHEGYGSAQRMYFKRGYIPDGSGAWYGDQKAEPYANYCLDDSFTIYLSKKLR